ncbi:MAG: pyrroline-5-carboxylate reductase [Thermoanaerobaculia bacterium]|nr:pyrroline-5-carboxylate reductase [Thermoanaerobaculia bacterium]
MYEDSRVAVIGAGKMGATLVHALRGGGLPGDRIVATGRSQARLEELAAAEGVRTSTDNREAVAGASLVLLCVKPQGVAELLAEIGPVLGGERLLVSIAAGVTTDYLERRLPEGAVVVRAMPNTPSLIGAGMTALCGGRAARPEHLEVTREIFAEMGRVVVLEERYFDAVTGLSASGPAFAYIIIESLAEGGVKVGLPRSVATELAAQACLGAARMVLETGNPPALLKDDVTTPAGCTMDGILTLEEGGLRVTLIKAVVEATRRAGELVEE